MIPLGNLNNLAGIFYALPLEGKTMKITENIHLIAPSWAYVYLVIGEKIALVDTGLPQYLDDIRSYIRNVGLRLRDVSFIINTHVHGDHVACNKALKKLSGAKLAVHELDAKYIEDPESYLKDTSHRSKNTSGKRNLGKTRLTSTQGMERPLILVASSLKLCTPQATRLGLYACMIESGEFFSQEMPCRALQNL